jgi:hypothetical protein
VSTVASRKIRSTPHRSASDTWTLIVELLTRGNAGAARTELLAIAGVASSIITDQFPKDAPIVITCDGPRTRIRCTYDEDAIDGTNASEDVLGFDPLAGEWMLSFPCGEDDLPWVQAALKGHPHVCARSLDDKVEKASMDSAGNDQPLEIDVARFLGR